MTFKLQRCSASKDGVFGILTAYEKPQCLTLERPWLHNEPNTSCIPSGIYDCFTWNSQKFGKTWQIGDVPGRSAILLHSGNFIADTHGCIIVGHSLIEINGQTGVGQSKPTMDDLHKILPDHFKLEIYWPQGFNPN